MSVLNFRAKVVAGSRQVSIKDRDWTLQIKRVTTRDGRQMFLVQPVQARFIQMSSTFLYDEVKPAIWLTPHEFSVLIKALQKLEGNEPGECGSGDSDTKAGEVSS